MSFVSVSQKKVKLSALTIAFFIIMAISSLAADSSVLLTWTAPGDDGNVGRASSYDLRYSTSPINASNWNSATQISNEPTPKEAGGIDSLWISGLIPNITYYFAIKSADEAQNWSDLSNLAMVVTSDDSIAPAQITDLEADGGSTIGALILNWTASGDDGTVGTASYYRIACSTDSAVTANWNGASIISNPVAPMPSGQEQSYTISSLLPGERYWVAIRVYDDQNNYTTSNLTSGIAAINIAADADDDNENVPSQFELLQNYPNPFNPSTIINYSLGRDTHVNLSVYNILGQHILTLVDKNQSSGSHEVVWEGVDKSGSKVSSGMYLYILKTNDYTESRKMILQK